MLEDPLLNVFAQVLARRGRDPGPARPPHPIVSIEEAPATAADWRLALPYYVVADWRPLTPNL